MSNNVQTINIDDNIKYSILIIMAICTSLATVKIKLVSALRNGSRRQHNVVTLNILSSFLFRKFFLPRIMLHPHRQQKQNMNKASIKCCPVLQ